MNKDNKLVSFLSGAIEYSNDDGLGWREEYKELLADLNIDCIIPNNIEALTITQEELNRLKKEDINKYIKVMRELIYIDLEIVESSDLVICRWAGEIISGTVGEVQHAYLSGIPTYLVTTKSLNEVPGWFLACFDNVFTSSCDLLERLILDYCINKEN